MQDRLGAAFAIGGVLYLVLSFAYAFTFTYAYTLDLFRDLGLPVFLIAGLLTGLPTLALPTTKESAFRLSKPRLLTLAVAGAGLAVLIFVTAFPPRQSQLPILVNAYN